MATDKDSFLIKFLVGDDQKEVALGGVSEVGVTWRDILIGGTWWILFPRHSYL